MDHELELIIPDPGNVWNFAFNIFSYPGNTKIIFCLCSTILEILDILFLYILPKSRAPKNDPEWSDFCAQISHMTPIQSQKLKLLKVPIHGRGSGGRSPAVKKIVIRLAG